MATHAEIRRIKNRYGRKLMGAAGVSGVGIEKDEEGDYCLVVHLADDSAREALPEKLDGHAIRYVKSGPFVKRTK